jgi:PPOX class probable F420-dependent enzyme
VSRRDQVTMTDAELRSYLAGRRSAIFTTNGPDGYPHSVPMTYLSHDDHVVEFTTYARSQKVRNLERNAKVSLVVETGERYEELQGVFIQADAEIVTDPDEVRRIMLDTRRKLGDDLSDEHFQQVEDSLPKRVGVRCVPLRISSWDHTKLPAGTY